MNREAAKKLVTECWEDARAVAAGSVVSVGESIATFRALVAARLAPEQGPVVEFAAAFGAAPDLPEPRPSYVPEGAPWEWTTLADGERVAMWASAERVRLHDPDFPSSPWVFSLEYRDKPLRIGPTAMAAVEAFGRKHGVWE